MTQENRHAPADQHDEPEVDATKPSGTRRQSQRTPHSNPGHNSGKSDSDQAKQEEERQLETGEESPS